MDGEYKILNKHDMDACFSLCADSLKSQSSGVTASPALEQKFNSCVAQCLMTLPTVSMPLITTSAPTPADASADSVAGQPNDSQESLMSADAGDVSCANDGYYIENRQCKPKTFNIVMNTKIPGIPKSMSCVWNDKMLETGINGNGGFDDGCSLPLIAHPETFGLTQFSLCRWHDMDSDGTLQQRITNLFYTPISSGMTIPENGHTFRVKSVCRTNEDHITGVDYY
jgi:hypothetical protein